jgi:cell division protein FtsQ
MIKINRKILNMVSWFFISAALVAAVGFAEKSNQEVLCKGLEVVVVDSTGHYFVSPGDIQELFKSKSASVEGKPMSGIDFRMMEKRTMTNPYLESAEVYATIDGRIRIEVAQRNPVIRVINYNNDSCLSAMTTLQGFLWLLVTSLIGSLNVHLFLRSL